jgi:hypothetical protein
VSDSRIVQCFGVKRRPRKPARVCRQKYLWIARGASAGNFGRKGTQACPNCGTAPDFRHPLNRYYNRELTYEEATAAMPEYIKNLKQS